MREKWILILGLFVVPAFAGAEVSRGAVVLPFSSVWRAVKDASPSQKAASAGTQAAEIASDRSGRHWFPRLFVDARAYETNDPAQTFFALLGERQASSSDFLPSTLNHPGSNFFTQAGVGLDLPLFEGGARVAEHESLKTAARAKALAAQEVLNEDYLNSTKFYGALLALQDQARLLAALQGVVDSILQKYSLGGRANPIGYSGLLGLKGLRNRLQAGILQSQEQIRASRDSLSEMAKGLPENWVPELKEFLVFVEGALPLPKEGDHESSFAVKAAQVMVESKERASQAEKAKFLPKVGLFADEDMNGGSRGTGASYSGGAYLQWNIFSATDYGSIREAELRTAEAAGNADARALGERIQQAQARHADFASEQTIRLLNENVELLGEQTEASRKLYLSGSINALQFLEVLSRRADVLTSLTQAELELLTARVTQLQDFGF